MPNKLAPIALSAYARLGHVQRTVAALQKNALAGQSELFVFSDAPRLGDEAKVAAVREYLRTIGGFKSVQVIERTENGRVANNRGGIRYLLERYGRMIFIEEDTITAPGFLTFMNEALERYEGDSSIFSITGYCPDFGVPEDCEHDALILPRFNAWGFGLWKDNFEDVLKMDDGMYWRVYGNSAEWMRLSSACGQDVLENIERDFMKEVDALDMKITFWQFLAGKYTLYPRRSLACSIGNDGSGEHMVPTTKWDADLWQTGSFKWPGQLRPDPAISKAHYDFQRVSLWGRMGILMRRWHLFPLYRAGKRMLRSLGK